MTRYDHGDERQWLGGEAHIPLNNGRLRPFSLWRWLALGPVTRLAGVAAAAAALGSLGTVGVMNRQGARARPPGRAQPAQAAKERRTAMEHLREEYMERRDERQGGQDVGVVLAAFGLGLMAGTAVVLLTTPESGASVRARLRRGMETARRELDDIVDETAESWGVVRDDARDAVKRTAAKIKEAAKVTRDAVTESGKVKPNTP